MAANSHALTDTFTGRMIQTLNPAIIQPINASSSKHTAEISPHFVRNILFCPNAYAYELFFYILAQSFKLTISTTKESPIQ